MPETRTGTPEQYGNLVIVSAPSGTGKTTLVKKLLVSVPDIVKSLSYTSRPIRSGERDGVDYNFVDQTRFAQMEDSGMFLEHATVFGHRYGTSATDTERRQRQGKDVVLVIDVQGARQVRAHDMDTVSVFVLPPSYQVLEARLRGRSGTDVSEEVLQRRLSTACMEVLAREAYDYVVVNDDIESCVDRLRCIVLAERSRTAAMTRRSNAIAATFVSGGPAS